MRVSQLQTPSGGHVVVTGVAGFIGSHLADALVARGHQVVGIDCFTPAYPADAKRANLERLLPHPAFRLVEGDLVTMPLDPWLEGASVVFHLAAQPGVRASWGGDFAVYVHHNVLGTQSLLEAIARSGVPRLVAASSSSVYGDAPSYPTTEASLTRPVSPYGVTKLASEHLCLAYARPGVAEVSVVTLRYFTVYGRRQRPDMAFQRFLHAAATGQPVTVLGDGEQTRDFTHVDDVVRANLLAMDAPVHAEAINVGGGRRASINDALDLIGRYTGRPIRVDHAPAQVGDARHTAADGARAEALLGYRPEVSLEDGLADQVAAFAGMPNSTRVTLVRRTSSS
ncbi:MAG TPA: NAD-dependent epimerase/dehydratase family protein [Actinomycetota bacterium]|nr:NAD-dependent epimerase/dehydratase family protein [Actinomycetota bacterium]